MPSSAIENIAGQHVGQHLADHDAPVLRALRPRGEHELALRPRQRARARDAPEDRDRHDPEREDRARPPGRARPAARSPGCVRRIVTSASARITAGMARNTSSTQADDDVDLAAEVAGEQAEQRRRARSRGAPRRSRRRAWCARPRAGATACRGRCSRRRAGGRARCRPRRTGPRRAIAVMLAFGSSSGRYGREDRAADDERQPADREPRARSPSPVALRRRTSGPGLDRGDLDGARRRPACRASAASPTSSRSASGVGSGARARRILGSSTT